MIYFRLLKETKEKGDGIAGAVAVADLTEKETRISGDDNLVIERLVLPQRDFSKFAGRSFSVYPVERTDRDSFFLLPNTASCTLKTKTT